MFLEAPTPDPLWPVIKVLRYYLASCRSRNLVLRMPDESGKDCLMILRVRELFLNNTAISFLNEEPRCQPCFVYWLERDVAFRESFRDCPTDTLLLAETGIRYLPSGFRTSQRNEHSGQWDQVFLETP